MDRYAFHQKPSQIHCWSISFAHCWSVSFAHILCDSGVVGNIDVSLLRLWKVVLADVAEAEFIELTVYQLM